MPVSRRRFCLSAAGASIATTGVVSGRTAAQQEIQVSGTIRSEVDADPAGTTVELFNPSDPTQRLEATIDSNGRFSGSLAGPGTYHIVYFNRGAETGLIKEPDNLPLVYFFREIQISEGGELGEFVLPEGDFVSIRFVSSDGEPIENLPVNFRAENGAGVRPGAFTTTPDGFVKFTDASQPGEGIELAGRTTIEIQPESGTAKQLRTINVTDQMNLRITVTNPTQYPNVEINTGDGETDGSQSKPTVSGRILSASGDALPNNALKFVDTQAEEAFTTTTDPDGAFEIELPGNAQYLFNYIQSSSAEVVPDTPDNVPSHVSLRSISVGEGETELGTVELPQAYRVDARVVDADGRPVEGAPVQIRSDGFGLPPGTFTTNQDGYIKHSGADQAGVDLAGPVQIGAWPPGAQRQGKPPALKPVIVDQERSLTLTLDETIAGGTSGGASSPDGRQRGFLTNSGNEPAFLSNPFNLTTLGFLLSVGGIVHQMMGGR